MKQEEFASNESLQCSRNRPKNHEGNDDEEMYPVFPWLRKAHRQDRCRDKQAPRIVGKFGKFSR